MNKTIIMNKSKGDPDGNCAYCWFCLSNEIQAGYADEDDSECIEGRYFCTLTGQSSSIPRGYDKYDWKLDKCPMLELKDEES